MSGVERGSVRGKPKGAGPSEKRVPKEIKRPGEPEGDRNVARPGQDSELDSEESMSGLTADIQHTEKPDRKYR